MIVNEVTFTDVTPFDGYGPGFFRLAGEVHAGNRLVWAEGSLAWGGYDDPDSILAIRDKIDFILLGTGAEIAHPPAGFRTALEQADIGIETMGTPSACRTFNVLLSEERRVAAAVLAI